MAAPLYAHDLTDIDLAEVIGSWTVSNFSGGGGAAAAPGADLAMQGAACIDRQVSTHERGIVWDDGAPITGATAAGVHIFQWLYVATPGITATIGSRGAWVQAGSGAVTNCVQFLVEGSDTYGASGRVGKCYPYRYTGSASGTHPYRIVTGTPPASPQFVGAGITTLAPAKGSNLGVDAVRYGKGAFLTAGDATDPITLTGFASSSDSLPERWGLLTDIGGTLEQQGGFTIGQNSSGTPTQAYFESSDINVVFVDTFHAESTFNHVTIDHAATSASFNNISYTALGTVSPGKFVVNVANPWVSIVGGTWTNIGTTEFRSNSTANGLTWRGTDWIQQSGSVITNCVITSNIASASLHSDNPGLLSNNTFIGSGSENHGIECRTPGTYTLTGNDFQSFGAADTSASAFFNNSGGAITLNVTDASSPTVRNSVGSSTTVNNNVSVTFKGLQDLTEVRIYAFGTTTELAGIEDAVDVDPEGKKQFTFALGAGVATTAVFHSLQYVYQSFDYTIPASLAVVPVQQQYDRYYKEQL